MFQAEFVSALASADEAVLAAVFTKATDPIPADDRLSPETIVDELVNRGVPARTIDGVPAIRDYLIASARAGDVIAIMSNGAFGGLPALVASGLGAA